MPSTTKATTAKATDASFDGFTAEERAAMKEHARELKADARRRARGSELDPEQEVLAKIAEMPEPDRALAERIHAIIAASAPSLTPRLWYGMPAYAKGSKMICFFQTSQKFKTKYSTLGFSDAANLDDGNMWPTSYALMTLTKADEARIAALIKQAAG
jgi:uncharacterized protein YdhG (YjbR/CyaY superfamily)